MANRILVWLLHYAQSLTILGYIDAHSYTTGQPILYYFIYSSILGKNYNTPTFLLRAKRINDIHTPKQIQPKLYMAAMMFHGQPTTLQTCLLVRQHKKYLRISAITVPWRVSQFETQRCNLDWSRVNSYTQWADLRYWFLERLSRWKNPRRGNPAQLRKGRERYREPD